ncbi:hypothetical protein CEXT_783741 [Caerostris extrusa]|uniref:Uncharacterized protein n=1 Tax=Caerostris extrusa TaxID=172846 RepID=A0AAV4R3M6_CAEEX|nr:hypothetical protein CEXT_783741 [Caerostris extrusa]
MSRINNSANNQKSLVSFDPTNKLRGRWKRYHYSPQNISRFEAASGNFHYLDNNELCLPAAETLRLDRIPSHQQQVENILDCTKKKLMGAIPENHYSDRFSDEAYRKKEYTTVKETNMNKNFLKISPQVLNPKSFQSTPCPFQLNSKQGAIASTTNGSFQYLPDSNLRKRGNNKNGSNDLSHINFVKKKKKSRPNLIHLNGVQQSLYRTERPFSENWHRQQISNKFQENKNGALFRQTPNYPGQLSNNNMRNSAVKPDFPNFIMNDRISSNLTMQPNEYLIKSRVEIIKSNPEKRSAEYEDMHKVKKMSFDGAAMRRKYCQSIIYNNMDMSKTNELNISPTMNQQNYKKESETYRKILPRNLQISSTADNNLTSNTQKFDQKFQKGMIVSSTRNFEHPSLFGTKGQSGRIVERSISEPKPSKYLF